MSVIVVALLAIIVGIVLIWAMGERPKPPPDDGEDKLLNE